MDHASLPSLGPGLQRTWASSPSGSPLRVLPWQGDKYTALIGLRSGRTPTSLDIHRCVEALARRGVLSAVTPALSPHDSEPFVQAGFALREQLHLLAYRLDQPGPHGFLFPDHLARTIKRGQRWHRRAVLEIDRRAFETSFWQFDAVALSEARRATPTSRYRVAMANGLPVGYAVTGRSEQRGYLQRLAIDPSSQGQGLGRGLVHDTLRWLHGRGATVAMVNTQEVNTRALTLYEEIGFVMQAEGLSVLHWQSSP